MTFLAALRELKEGRCEGIKRSDGSIARLEDGQLCGLPDLAELYFANDWQLVHPIRLREDVEVKVWAEVVKSTGKVMRTSNSSDRPENVSQDYAIIELAGTFAREIKPKVMRREDIIISESERANAFYKAGIEYNGRIKVYAEWEE